LRDPVRVTVGSEDLSANSRVAQGVCGPSGFPMPCTALKYLSEIEVFDDEREKEYVTPVSYTSET